MKARIITDRRHRMAGLLGWAAMVSLLLGAQRTEANTPFDGLDMNPRSLPRLSNAESRSISPENPTGEKGKGGMATEGTGSMYGRELGQGWKISPSVWIQAGQTFVVADVNGPGAIQHIWITNTGNDRLGILRFYWDGEEHPSVECPVGDFFASGAGQHTQVNSSMVCVNPYKGFNCYWSMPFRKHCKITMTNLNTEPMRFFYQIDYTLTDVPNDMAYFHAQFRRVNPLPYKEVYTLIDGIQGQGHYVGTYMTWGSNSPGWWGRGEIKFFIDGDNEFPTICGTGTEDYFGGSHCFGGNVRTGRGYQMFCSPYSGMPQVILSAIQPRFGLYRWHILDPVRFKRDLKVTIQALGLQSWKRYLPLQDDISSVVFWYQTEPHQSFPELPEKKDLLIEIPQNNPTDDKNKEDPDERFQDSRTTI